MHTSQSSIAFKAYLKPVVMEKEAGMIKTIAMPFMKALGRRTVDSAARTFEGGKRYFHNLRPGAGNYGQRAADAKLMAHQNFGGGMSGYGTSPLKSNFVEDKFHINHAFNNMGRRGMQRALKDPSKIRNAPDGFTDWMSGLNEYQRGSLMRHLPSRRGVGAADAMRNYSRDIYGSPLNRMVKGDANKAFDNMYQRYGQVADNAGSHAAEVWGNRVGNFLGPAAITLPAISAPFALSEWAGAAGAGTEAKDLAARAGRQAVADDLYQFEQMPMMNRLQMMWNPQAHLQQIYQNPDSMPTALAHHYMYGAGKNERIKDPGITDYLKHLALPFFTEDPLQRSLQARGVNGMQSMAERMALSKAAAHVGFLKTAGFMKALPKVFGAFRTPGKLMTGTANTLKSLGSAKNVAGRTALSAGVGGVSNVMAGDENSNAFQRFIVGAGAGAGLGFGGNKLLRKGFQSMNKSMSPALRRMGAASSKEYGRNMHWLARQALPGSGNSQMMQNLAGTAYKIRRHPILTAGALYTPYGMYDSYQQGRGATLDAAEQAGSAGGHATVADMMANQGFLPRMMAALNPSMAAGALQNIDPQAYSQYAQRKMNPVDMVNNGMPYYAR